MKLGHWFFLLFFFFALPLQATELRLSPDQLRFPLSAHALAFEDTSGTQGTETVMQKGDSAVRPELLRGSLAQSAIWLRFDIRNDAAQVLTRWLVLEPATLLDVQLFIPMGTQIQHLRAGVTVPFSQRPVSSAVPVFPITLAAGETTTVYLRIAGPKSRVITPILWESLEFRAQEGRKRLFDGLLLGGFLMISLIGAVLLALFRDRIFLFNALATASFFLGEFNAKGYALLHLWPQAVDLTVRGGALFAAIGVGLNLLFLRALLGTRQHFPRIDRLLLLLLALEWLMLPGVIFGDIDFWRKLSFPLHFPITTIMVLIGLYAAMRGVHAARYYAVAYFLLALGSVGQVPMLGAWLPAGMAGYMLPIGMLLNNLFLLAAAVDRIIMERRAAFAAKNALLAERAAQEAKLQEAVEIRTAELNSALIETRQARESQSRLIAYLSHDLRAPLATIINGARQFSGSSQQDVGQHQEAILRSAQHQLELIDDLVEYARGELDRLELVPIPTYFIDWLDSVAAQGELLAVQNGNRFIRQFDDDLPPVVVFDGKRLRQVLLNLLGNAGKFTHSGTIRLDVVVLSQQADHVGLEFVVEDSGTGIPPADLERIFLPFERSDVRRAEGHGLGLSIARHIVLAMGSELAVSSQSNLGSRFVFRVKLPVVDETDVPQPDDIFTLPEAFGAGKTLLVVDDNPAALDYLCEVLGTADFDVLRARNGMEALQIAREQRFDACLLDQYLPDMTGWDVLRALHEAGNQAVPAILCSAAPPKPPADHPTNINFAAIMLKPAHPEKLLKILNDLLD